MFEFKVPYPCFTYKRTDRRLNMFENMDTSIASGYVCAYKSLVVLDRPSFDNFLEGKSFL